MLTVVTVGSNAATYGNNIIRFSSIVTGEELNPIFVYSNEILYKEFNLKINFSRSVPNQLTDN